MDRSRLLRFAGALCTAAVLAAACASGDGSTVAAEPAPPTATAAAAPTAAPTSVPGPDVISAVAQFDAQPSRDNAAALIDAFAADGDSRWAPWLIDLLRFGSTNVQAIEIGTVLEAMSGIESTQRIPNLIAYGSWSQQEGFDGGDGYRDFKTSIYSRIDPEFGPLLESVRDQTQLAAIQWGGVPRGGIPELNDPERVPVADADWMVPDEVVLGVLADGAAVAYPLRIIARHELANDTVGDLDIAVVYCTLCRSGLVYERVVDGRLLNFQTSGLLLNSNKIMVDRETDTLWHHLEGAGIGGELIDTELTLLPSRLLRWSDWIAEFPDSEVLAIPPPIFFDDPERPPIAYDYSAGEAYRSYYESEAVWFPILDTPDDFDIKDEVIGIEHEGESFALGVADLNAAGVTVEVEVGGASFTVEPTGVSAIVRDADGAEVAFEQSFWFAWFANHPGTRIG